MINNIKFLGSFPSCKKCPKTTLPEYAFIGRSNVGKSSLINMLTGRKALAKVSNTPGKTQLINFFEIEEEWNLVDLPGFGYARLSKKHRASLRKMIQEYFLHREQLQCAFLLIDCRHSLQAIDLEFGNWFGEQGIPFMIIFTKADKLKPRELKKNLMNIEQSFLEYWEEMPRTFVSSSVSRVGREEILKLINQVNSDFRKK